MDKDNLLRNDMISIVIPTRNRAYTLKKVLHTYYQQKLVDQIVIINDGSTDNTTEMVNEIASCYPNIETTLITNEFQHGSSYCKNLGASSAKNQYVLFGEDDAYISEGYSEVLLKKLKGNKRAGIVSGRLIILSPGEDPSQAVKRFGNGNVKVKKTFNFATFSHLPDAFYQNDITLPLTHALILTYKDLLLEFPFDTNYSKGNAFREESDFQANAYINGYDILVTNDTHCMHLNSQDVRTGGHRTPVLNALWYKIYYTHHFYKKYYNHYKPKLGLILPRRMATIRYGFTQIFELFIAGCFFIKKRLSILKMKISGVARIAGK